MKLKYIAAVLIIGVQSLNAWGWNSDEKLAVEDFFKNPAVQAISLFAERNAEYQAIKWSVDGAWESGDWSNGDDLIGHIIHNYELGGQSEDEATKMAMLSVRHAVWLLNVNSGLQRKFGPIDLIPEDKNTLKESLSAQNYTEFFSQELGVDLDAIVGSNLQ